MENNFEEQFRIFKKIEEIDNDDRLEELIATCLLLEQRLDEKDMISAENLAEKIIKSTDKTINIEHKE